MIRDNTGAAGGQSAGCSGQARLKPSSGGYQKMLPQSGRGTPYETRARDSATDRHEESAAPRRLFDAMQAAPTLGVLGGMGPAATAHFMKQLAASVEATTDQGHPKTMLLSDPSIPDRTQAILRGTYEPLAPIRDGLLTLCGWGADLLAIPCNSAHYFIDLVSDTIPAKIIDIVEATLDRASAANPEGAWLAATDGTVLGRMYQRRAAMMDYRLILPPENLQKVIQEAVHAVKGKELETSATLIAEATRKLWILEDIAIIQGCTEIPIAYDMAGLPPCRSVSSVDALASACVNELQAFSSASEKLQSRPAIEKRSEPDTQIQEQNL
ncbi:aspartate/glutamate racemase family protein [Streptomyces mirabilis]|uniref:aspartate/glutamate racemase family protein n=2 Tax=Streptomyces mirabilis TaxID=68239 RepID=UPI00352BD19A